MHQKPFNFFPGSIQTQFSANDKPRARNGAAQDSSGGTSDQNEQGPHESQLNGDGRLRDAKSSWKNEQSISRVVAKDSLISSIVPRKSPNM